MIFSVLALILAACSGDDGGSEQQSNEGSAELRIGVFPVNGSILPVFVEELGLYEEHGIAAELVTFTDRPTGIQGLLTGDVDVLATATDVPAFVAEEEGPSLKAIAGVYRGLALQLVVPPDSPLNKGDSLKGLKGMTIGSVGPTVALHLALVKLMEDEGMDPNSDVEFETLPFASAGIASFEKGQVDAWEILEPTTSILLQRGTGKVILDTRFDDTSLLGVPSASLVATSDFIDSNEEILKRFITATCEGAKEARGDPSEAADRLEAYYRETVGESLDVSATRASIVSDVRLWDLVLDRDDLGTWLKVLFDQDAVKKSYTYDDIVAMQFESEWNC